MKDIKLPVMKKIRYEDRHLSMDDYLKFVLTNLKHTVDMNSVRALKKKLFVNVRFILR